MALLTRDELEAMEPGDVIYDFEGDEVMLVEAGHWEYTCIGGDRDVQSLEWCADELVSLGATRTPHPNTRAKLKELIILWGKLTPEDQDEFRDMML